VTDANQHRTQSSASFEATSIAQKTHTFVSKLRKTTSRKA